MSFMAEKKLSNLDNDVVICLNDLNCSCINKEILKIMVDKEIKRKDLAKNLGWSYDKLSDRLSGSKQITFEDFSKILTALGCHSTVVIHM